MRPHNRYFKRPDSSQSLSNRSPSPPRRFVEPISPSGKPMPLEPIYNYPAVDQRVHHPAKSEHIGTDTYSIGAANITNGKRKHQRASSTIDTLAEVALAVSPAYHAQNLHIGSQGPGHAHPRPYAKISTEPPHKRARSELFPATHIIQQGERPATSYEAVNGWTQADQVGQGKATYDSRVEEAALLLNFHTGGWPATHKDATVVNQHVPLEVSHQNRPHANSFPRDTHTNWVRSQDHRSQISSLRETQFNASNSFMPPLSSRHDHAPAKIFTFQEMHHGPTEPKITKKSQNARSAPIVPSRKSAQTPTDHAGSPAPSSVTTLNDIVDGPVKSKRGWPKGKPRNGRKLVADKVGKGRASRKKTPDSGKAAKRSRGAARLDASSATIAPAKRRDSIGAFSHERVTTPVDRSLRASSVPSGLGMIIHTLPITKPPKRTKQVTQETICAGCALARESASANAELAEWISCNGCKKWFHVDCAGFKKAHEVRDVDKYFCATCEPKHGKTTFVRKSARAHASVDYAELQKGVLKTSEESNEHHYIQPIKDGTFQFDPETFPRVPPELVTRDYFERSNLFVEPICIPAAWNPRPWVRRKAREAQQDDAQATSGEVFDDGFDAPEDFEYDMVVDDGQDKLDMVMPEELTVRQVCNMVGADVPLDVIDVKTQNSGSKWTLGRWADYYEEQSDDKPIRNVISLEVSQTKLGRLLRRPKLVRDIDLQDEVWPQKETDQGKWPKVQFYCLMSVADSYTDFHIDFGGSSVYYHILKGKKTFFFIPPKPKHLKAYEDWNDSPHQNYTFLPSITKECYRVDLSEGDTMLIPSGWIHAVWTPETSLVIGGNFLTRMSFKNQFKVAEIEKANETPMKFRYPYFQRIMWYTAIKYMQDDPLPEEVSQLFYEGQQFERKLPLWADYDSDLAADDDRPGAKNARYYSQAEVEGLPDLVQFIFRTVMIVKGCVEGITQDRIKRVYASIPKGYGEPLEVAKTFALWVAWKRGNEDIPAWAHPDAVLSNSKEEGPVKKLSQRALREMERKEAIAAYRIAPDRQSARIKNTTSPAGPALGGVNPVATTPEHDEIHQPRLPTPPNEPEPVQQPQAAAPMESLPMNFVMNGMLGAHLSTPKTSVLGPKRVACDVCRKRRIKCKHKDLVTQIPASQLSSSTDTADVHASSQPVPDFYDNITLSPVRPGQIDAYGNMSPQGGQILYASGQTPLPGTNAYINANIPMAMNGVSIFGETPKRGRSKACFECRKSKRRCVHDENGNVDPVKAAETPVPRGSLPSKKRSPGVEGSPASSAKRAKTEDGLANGPFSPAISGGSPQSGQENYAFVNGGQHQFSHSATPEHQQQPSGVPQSTNVQQYGHEQSQIDPNLFSFYSDASANQPYGTSGFAYHATHSRNGSYNLPSLEQIASEVLDMNGTGHNEQHEAKTSLEAGADQHKQSHAASLDESIDSAISLPDMEQSEKTSLNAAVDGSAQAVAEPVPSVESLLVNGATASEADRPETKDGANSLPLYCPPAPLSQSPEMSRRQLNLPNGVPTTPVSQTTSKRKRDSISTPAATPKSSRKSRALSNSTELPTVDDQGSLELARQLQQADSGLRRRGVAS